MAWSAESGDAASEGSFADAAGFGELVLNCTAGAGALDAVGAASAQLEGKVLIDVSNPLEFPDGSPSTPGTSPAPAPPRPTCSSG